MIKVEISHKGKKYNDITSATLAAMASGLKETIEKQIAPFRDEVKAEGGEVKITVNYSSLNDFGAELSVSNISEDLKSRITEALKQSPD